MVKTLKITSILLAIAAIGFIAFIAFRGVSADENIEAFLDKAGIAEQLQAQYAGKKTPKQDRQTPLIRQAADFALRIDPPPPPAPAAPVTRRPSQPSRSNIPRPKAAVSAKFKLIGTSYHNSDEDNSWALLSEVGKGLHWVKLGDMVGHLKIVKIGDGAIRILDGNSSYELTAERKEKPDYVISYSGQQDNQSNIWKPTGSTKTEITAQIQKAETVQVPVMPEVTKESIQDNIEWLKQLQQNPEELGMTAEEAKEMEGLGKMLQDLEGQLEKAEEKEKAEPKADRSALDAFLKKVAEEKKAPPKRPPVPNNRIRRKR